MLYNIVSVVSLVITLLLTKLTIGAKKRDLIARTVSVAVFAYKLVYFAYVNVKGTFSAPVEKHDKLFFTTYNIYF